MPGGYADPITGINYLAPHPGAVPVGQGSSPAATPGPLPPGVGAPGEGSGGPGDFNNAFYWNADPNAGFWQYLMQSGLSGGVDPKSRYAQNQYQKTYSQYSAEAGDDPNMGFYDYLQKRKPDLAGEFQNQSPEQRGDFSTQRLTPRARWTSG